MQDKARFARRVMVNSRQKTMNKTAAVGICKRMHLNGLIWPSCKELAAFNCGRRGRVFGDIPGETAPSFEQRGFCGSVANMGPSTYR